MTTINKLVLAGSIVCASAVAGAAQDLTKPLPSAQDSTKALPSDYRTQPGESFLTKANKASGLIGMDVRNQQNEKLGDIKDLAVDLHSGRIAYAVLSVGGFLGIGDKYIAVPSSEFSISPDGKELILNADKARLQGAPGFAKNNWPDLNSWQTHSTYWLPEGSAVGTPGATVRTGRETGGTLDTGVLSSGTVAGRVIAVDRGLNVLTVENAAGKHQFLLNERATVTLTSDPNARLESIKVGDHITVRFHDQGGSKVVDTISDSQRIENR
jgi:sporulation protein YlmC with PRC-barrel domain